MSYEILESLGSVGYDGKLIDETAFSEAINEGFKNDQFRELIMWLSNEISELGKLEERITSTDVNSFLIELSGFLKEMQCSYDILTSDGNINNRMQTVELRYLLLEFLIAELMTYKMFLVKQKPKEKGSVITLHESSTAAALKEIAITLNLGKPPENISADALFAKINSRFDEALRNIPDGQKRIGNALFNPKTPLNGSQWVKVEEIQKTLEEEYNLRRKMLSTRLDVTVQSFKWSERIKGKEKDINEKYSNRQQTLDKLVKGEQRTDIVALLAAREKLAIIEKTSSANVRKNTKSKLQRHIIGRVPDRGGRALECQKPPPEMPAWQKRQPGGDRGGFNRGGFQQQKQQHQQHNNSQGYPPQQFQQKAPYNPSNQQQYSGANYNNQQQNYNQGSDRGRVQGGWSQRGNSSSYDNRRDDSFRGGNRGGRGNRRY